VAGARWFDEPSTTSPQPPPESERSYLMPFCRAISRSFCRCACICCSVALSTVTLPEADVLPAAPAALVPVPDVPLVPLVEVPLVPDVLELADPPSACWIKSPIASRCSCIVSPG